MPTPGLITGALGEAIDILGVATLTVTSPAEWVSPGTRPCCGVRQVTVGVTVVAGMGLTLTDSAFSVMDAATGLRHGPLAVGAQPQLALPVQLEEGEVASGLLTFEVPLGERHVLAFAPSLRFVAQVDVVGIVALPTQPPMARTPTPTPIPRPTPGPTATIRVTPRPTVRTASAQTYANSTITLYSSTIPRWVDNLSGGCMPGGTVEECTAARESAVKYGRDPAIAAINDHLDWMKSWPAASCFRDAYDADRRVASNWLTTFQNNLFWGDGTPEFRAAKYPYQAAQSKANVFRSNLSGYFSDC